ncbi:hypothetical protein NG895_04555 [Aeoliella sp. ICT_H6.2]|uniref:Uncharacterized protein n=1 Tax=Aeoliella straminimaris TaxID=2954799 RepID=A0A9X2JFC6_9BACT|nr:hypothetical protein [Aeoliella straminimaris]MCO6043167.1 hypothetical protein [Aeoliella straminimaris]
MHKKQGTAVVAALILTAGSTAAAVAQESEMDPASLAQKITAARRDATSGLIEYRRVKTVMEGREASQPVVFRHVVFAFDGEKRYLLARHLPGSAVRQRFAEDAQTDDSSSSGPGFVKTQLVYDGEEFCHVVNDQMVSIYSADTVKQKRKGTAFDPYYLKLMGWRISDPIAPSEANKAVASVFLPAVLTEPESNYAARTDQLDGHPCLVVEGSFSTPFGDRVHDKLWLSPEHDFLPLRREYMDSQGHLLASVVAEQPTRFAGDLWLPQVITNNNYTSSEEDPQTLKSQEVLELVDANFGEMDPELFSIQLPKPAIVTDYRTTRKEHSTYARHADGETSNMDSPVEYVADKLVQRIDKASSSTGRWAHLWLVLTIGFAITGLLLAWHRVAQHRA